MTQRHARDDGRNIAERWCSLAERRLDYLTELFESGRWRRFHSEVDFLDNIREAKAAVETWRGLAAEQASRNFPTWMDRPYAAPAHRDAVLHEAPRPRAMLPAEIRSAPLQPDTILVSPVETAAEPAESAEIIQLAPALKIAPDVAEPDTDWQTLLDPLVMHERYPILRNA
eukprot:gene12627-16830_t